MATIGQPLRMSNMFSVFSANRFSQLRRGEQVPNYPANAGVADNYPGLRFSQLLGATTDAPAPSAQGYMQDWGAEDVRGRGESVLAQASVTMVPVGVARYAGTSFQEQDAFRWLVAGNAGDFSVFAQHISGTQPNRGVFERWLPLDTGRLWMLSNTTLQQHQECVIRMTLQHNPTGQQWQSSATLIVTNGDPV